MANSSWDLWVEEALSKLESLKLVGSLRPLHLTKLSDSSTPTDQSANDELHHFYDGLRPWDRASVEVRISEPTFKKWLQDITSSGDDDDDHLNLKSSTNFRSLLIFSSNDYLGLNTHPKVIQAAVKATQEYGMGPRASALICGYTNYHRSLETSLAGLKKKEDCILCPTGFAANTAFMSALASVGLLVSDDDNADRVAIFSDSLNHASIVDGIWLVEKQAKSVTYVYRHCDMLHLDALLSGCTMKKKVVVTDGLFSMDGDFAPLPELLRLRNKHGFLLVVDEAHTTFVCDNCFNCDEKEIDIRVGALSKALGSQGGFIACSTKWKQMIQARGRSFIFTTSIPLPIVAATQAAITVAGKETWRRKALWDRVSDFRAMTGIPIKSHIISLIVGTEEKADEASKHLLKSGFHVISITPPVVPPNTCRLRITLSAAHTKDDMRKLVTALSTCIDFQEIIGFYYSNLSAKL